MSNWKLIIGLVVLALGGGATPARACSGDGNSAFKVKKITSIRPPGQGGRVDWSSALDLIAYDRKDERGLHQIFVMKPDGSADRCITCGRAEIPQFVNGQPRWHPSGRYLVFQSANLGDSSPGAGVNAELWAYSFADDRFTQLTFLGATSQKGQYGVLHPHFSSSGDQLSWSEMYRSVNRGPHGELGYWKLKVADFVPSAGTPSLGQATEYEPGGPAFYENHGFVPGDSGLIFSANHESLPFLNKIYRMGFRREILTQLTRRHYNEHAEFSPDGSYILWMSSENVQGQGTDLWTMGPWGGDKTRLTYFNDPACPEFMSPYTIVADHSFGPGGKRIAIYAQHNFAWNFGGKDEAEILILEAE